MWSLEAAEELHVLLGGRGCAHWGQQEIGSTKKSDLCVVGVDSILERVPMTTNSTRKRTREVKKESVYWESNFNLLFFTLHQAK